jgi:hypothetical protein
MGNVVLTVNQAAKEMLKHHSEGKYNFGRNN